MLCRPEESDADKKEAEEVQEASASAQLPMGLLKDQGPPPESWEEEDDDDS